MPLKKLESGTPAEDCRDDPETALTRRAACGLIAMAATGAVAFATETPRRPQLGLVAYNCASRRKLMQQCNPKFDLTEPLTFLKHCHSLGAGDMQTSLGVLDAAQVKSLKEFAAERSLCVGGIANPPKDDGDLARFEAEIRTAAKVGVQAVRTVVMPGRRYEQFKSLTKVREAEAKALRMLELVAPIGYASAYQTVENDRGRHPACRRRQPDMEQF